MKVMHTQQARAAGVTRRDTLTRRLSRRRRFGASAPASSCDLSSIAIAQARSAHTSGTCRCLRRGMPPLMRRRGILQRQDRMRIGGLPWDVLLSLQLENA